MVSTAIAVLPVPRSPMISSRWPRPIGTRASIAFKPVWRGSCTDFLSAIPGALYSTGRVSVVAIGPLPSIGRPRASTTRPTIASPTGTCMMVPVRFTSSPSLMAVSPPRITAPTLSCSKFSTRPYISLPKSSSSPAIALFRPWIWAIPSPISITVPTSSTFKSVL